MSDSGLPAAMLVGYAVAPDSSWLVLYGLGLAHHLGCLLMSYAVWDRADRPDRWPGAGVGGSGAAVATSVGFALWMLAVDGVSPSETASLALVAAAAVLSTGTFASLLPRLIRPPVLPMRIHVVSNALLLIAGVIVAAAWAVSAG